ncbi:LysR family transcriptional regulator substrate-binding protein [Lactobacillus sp. W8172]|uniref:LysR family transcriptional regulator substrate-binding protein n=1 Tax=Lactobacillus sp. W8172 TaxID=2751025 RepID=UPI001E3B3078|nr:LysR family transcriptional regulator substrate-binding protein [Lactobacillus sp. W8172]
MKTKEILHSFSVEINSLRHEAATTYQELKVGYFSPFEGALLLQKIFDANQKQPELKIKITEESIEHLISDVSLGILDLAFILDYGEQEFLTKNLTNKSIFQSKMVIGVSKLNPLSSGSVFPLTALKEKPILYYGPEKTNYLKHAFLATLPEAYQNLPVARISTIEQMQILVSSNQANAYYPDGLLQPSNSPSEKIEYLPLEGNSSAQNYHVQAIYQKNTEKKKLIQQFLS